MLAQKSFGNQATATGGNGSFREKIALTRTAERPARPLRSMISVSRVTAPFERSHRRVGERPAECWQIRRSDKALEEAVRIQSAPGGILTDLSESLIALADDQRT